MDKICCACKREFPASADYYHRHKGQPDGFAKQCKECVRKHKADYYARNKEKVNKKNMENYYKKNPKEVLPEGQKKCASCQEVKATEHFGNSSKSKDGLKYSCKACRREREYLPNRELIRKQSKEWYENNKEYALKKQKAYKIKRREYYRQYDKKYYLENSDRLKENARVYLYNRVESDIGFKLLQRCRKRLWDAVKGHSKTDRTQELIGCTNEKLIEHLEGQFTDDMNWDNYGEWHIDHIMPCASFDFSNPEEQFKCFHYSNLQPLWAEDNYRKSDKIIYQDSALK